MSKMREALDRMVEMHDMAMRQESHGFEWQMETLKQARALLAEETKTK